MRACRLLLFFFLAVILVAACRSSTDDEPVASTTGALAATGDLCGAWHHVELSATRVYGSAASVQSRNGEDAHTFCEPIGVRIPDRLTVTAGRPGNGWAELDLGTTPHEVTCRYKGEAPPVGRSDYVLKNCNHGVHAGDLVQSQTFALRVESGDEAAGPTTVRVALDDGTPPPAGAELEILGTTPRLAGVKLRVPAGSVPPFSGVGLAEGPAFGIHDFVAVAPSGVFVAGPSVRVTGTGGFGPGVRLETPADVAWGATLPAGSLDTLRIVHVRDIRGPLEAIELGDSASDVHANLTAGRVDAELSGPGNYLTTIRDLTPLTDHAGPKMTGGANVYIIWAGVFDGKPDDPRPAVHRFLADLGGSTWNGIQSSYAIPNRNITLAGETARSDVTSFASSSPWDLVKKALDDRAFGQQVAYPDPNGLYFVLAGPGVTGAGYCSGLCGFHTWSEYGSAPYAHVRYAFAGHPSTCADEWTCGISAFGQTPNGKFVDGVLSVVAHEVVETITDPEPCRSENECKDGKVPGGWHGASEYGYSPWVENADKCAWIFTSRQGAGTAADPAYNLTVGSNRYIIQSNWVNQDDGYCAMGLESVGITIVAKPDGLAVNEIGTFTVRVQNTSAVFFDRNKLTITGRADGLLGGDPVPVPIPTSLAPGQYVDVVVPVQAPLEISGNVQPVDFRFAVRDPRNGHTFPARGVTTVDVRRAPVLFDQAECAGVTVPAAVNSGEWFAATMKFKNVGSTLWLASEYRLVGLPLDAPPMGNVALPRTVAKDDTVELTFYVSADAPPGGTYSFAGGMANAAAAFAQGCATSVPVRCVPNTGGACGSCGGTVQCDGACSVKDRGDLGQACGCGGAIQCDGSCSNPGPAGQACGCGGALQCDGSCSNPGPPDLGAERTVDMAESFGAFANYTKTFNPDPGWEYVSCTMTRNSGGGFGLLHPSSEGTCTADFASTGFLFLEGASFTIHLTERRVCD